MTPSRFPDTASATFRTAKQKEEKDLFPYVSVPRFDTSLTVVLNEKRSGNNKNVGFPVSCYLKAG